MASIFDNVRFDVIDVTLDTTKNIPVPVITPVALGIVGTLMLSATSKESDMRGLNERDRVSQYHLYTNLGSIADQYLAMGYLIRISYTRNLDTGGWDVVSPAQQYKIDYAYSSFGVGRDKTLALSRADV